MRHRPSTDRKTIDARWRKDKRGQWRHETTEVSEFGFCERATKEPTGFHKGARLRSR